MANIGSPPHDISKTLQKQLINDIEKQGGFQSSKLYQYLDTKKDVYGQKGSDLRKRVEIFIRRHRSNTETGLQESPTTSITSTRLFVSPGSPWQFPLPQFDTMPVVSPALQAFSPEGHDGYYEFLPPVQVRMSATGITLQRSGYGGIELFLLTEVPHKGRLYYGFEFSFVSEWRDVSQKTIKAALVAPNQVAFQLPSANAQFSLDYKKVWDDEINKPKTVNQQVKYHQLYCPRTAQAHAINAHKLTDNPHLKVRIVVLTFPTSMVLSNEKYSSDLKNGILLHAPVPMNSTITVKNKKQEVPMVINNVRNVWRILVEDEDAPRIVQVANVEVDAVDQMEAMLDQLGI